VVNAKLERTGSPIVPKRSGAGFTLIELIVVLTVLALLLTIAVPRYFSHIEHAKEATLKQDLSVMRDAIDKFHGDKGRYPDQLDELVSARYIRTIPVDPITEERQHVARGPADRHRGERGGIRHQERSRRQERRRDALRRLVERAHSIGQSCSRG
jgi:type II secretion system protein G